MTAQILPFPNQSDTSAPAFFVKIGAAHRKIADLFAAGRLPAQRIVVDASRLRFQQELLKGFRDEGAEIVLDTEVAELSSPRKFLGHSKNSPWVKPEWRKVWTPQDFSDDSVSRLADRIAEVAVANGIATVLSPSHYLSDRSFQGWLEIDRRLCFALRKSLDRLGGKHIAIDYPLIASVTELRDVASRGDLFAALSDLPFDNIWMRASGMESAAGPLQMKHFLATLERFHNVGRPIVVDYLGGLASLAALSFGAASGVSHGIGERERFYAGDWHLQPATRDEDDDGGGPATRVGIPSLGKSITKKELQLLASAPGGRRLCSCGDKRCCAHGLDDMLRDPRSHAAYQAFQAMDRLGEVPVNKRETYLIDGPMNDARRAAWSLSKLKPTNSEAERLEVNSEGLLKRFAAYGHQLDTLSAALERIHDIRSDDSPKAKPIKSRSKTTLSNQKEAP